MKKQLILFKSDALKMAFAALLFLAAGFSQTNAQTTQSAKGDKIEIPAEFISATKFSVTKSANPILSFTESTPYFTELNIVDGSNDPLHSVTTTDITDVGGNIVSREFNFSAVVPGNYFAQGQLTGTMVYYPIEVKD